MSTVNTPDSKAAPAEPDAASTHRSETTEQRVARFVAIPVDLLETHQLSEITMLADTMLHRSRHWQTVASQLQHESEDTGEESRRLRKLADALQAAAKHLTAATEPESNPG